MLPLKDENPTTKIPFITVGIIALNIVVFIYQLSFRQNMQGLIYKFGAIPYEITHNADLDARVSFPIQYTIITSMFMHGGILHIAGNMLYLWIFGNNIEDAMGHIKFIIFYIICGAIAAIFHILSNVDSQIPMVGASGAVSGILGAYMILYPKVKVLTLVIFGFFAKIIKVPAIFVIGLWIILQFLNGSASLGSNNTSGVAWFAHMGGFLSGVFLIKFFKRPWRFKI